MGQEPRRITMRYGIGDGRVVEEDIDPAGIDDMIERSPWDAVVEYGSVMSEEQIRRVAEVWPLEIVSNVLARRVPDDLFEAAAAKYPVTAFENAPERFTSGPLVEMAEILSRQREMVEIEKASRIAAEEYLDTVVRPAFREKNKGAERRSVVIGRRVYGDEEALVREEKL